MRDTRYQALIVQDHAVLLIKHRVHQSGHDSWVIPGGGLERGESETELSSPSVGTDGC